MLFLGTINEIWTFIDPNKAIIITFNNYNEACEFYDNY